MVCMSRRLESSTACRWWAAAVGPQERARSWSTRVGYCRAVAEALSRSATGEIDVAAIIRAHPQGRQSTVYAIAARGGLVQWYRDQSSTVARRIGDLIPSAPVPALVAEAKVWSFWPTRTAWVRELDERVPDGDFRTAGTRLVQVLAAWQAAEPALGTAQGRFPPLCAIEDLTILSRGLLSAERAGRLLMRAATTGVLEVPDELTPAACPALDKIAISGTAAQIDTAVQLLLDRSGLAEQDTAVGLLRAAARDLRLRGRTAT